MIINSSLWPPFHKYFNSLSIHCCCHFSWNAKSVPIKEIRSWNPKPLSQVKDAPFDHRLWQLGGHVMSPFFPFFKENGKYLGYWVIISQWRKGEKKDLNKYWVGTQSLIMQEGKTSLFQLPILSCLRSFLSCLGRSLLEVIKQPSKLKSTIYLISNKTADSYE